MYIEIEGSDKIRLALIRGIMDVGQGFEYVEPRWATSN